MHCLPEAIPADRGNGGSNNAKNGTSAARDSFQRVVPVKCPAPTPRPTTLGKFAGAQTAMFEGWGYAAWFATVIGVFELLGAIGLLILRLTRPAIYGLTGIMIGAAYTHLANGEAPQLVRPLIFTALLWSIWWLRRDPSTD